jgi:hypothetical protein
MEFEIEDADPREREYFQQFVLQAGDVIEVRVNDERKFSVRVGPGLRFEVGVQMGGSVLES